MAEFNDIVKDLRQSRYAPVYFLQGEEPFFIDNIVNHIEKNALDESQKSFNQYILYGKETELPTILNTARKFPMMGERQVVIIKEAQELKGLNKEEFQNLLINYLENPVPSTILVFAYKYKSLDKRTRLAKAFGKAAVVLSTKKIYENQVPGWVQGYAQAREAKISDRAVMLLTENIGNNLQRLANEIEKLLLNVDKGEEIDEKAVHKYVGISKEYNVFELQDAMTSGNHAKAQKIVAFFSSNSTSHPIVLTIFNIYNYFSKILLVHHSGASDQNTVAKVTGLHPFVARQYLNAARKYPLNKALYNLQLVHEADLRSKGINYNMGKDKEGPMLKELIFQLMN